MFKKSITAIMLTFLCTTAGHAATSEEVYEWLGELEGEWALSTTAQQQGSCYFPEDKIEDVEVGISFKYIARDTTIQENLLPDTERQMVTMYHCKDIACTNIRATHYCVKMNQPVYIANLEESTKNKLVFECDPSFEICNSNENYVYKVIHELSEDGETLKSSYLSREDMKPIPSTICNFE